MQSSERRDGPTWERMSNWSDTVPLTCGVTQLVLDTVAKPHTPACRARIEESMAGDEMARARLAETLLRRDKRRPLKDPETELPVMRRPRWSQRVIFEWSTQTIAYCTDCICRDSVCFITRTRKRRLTWLSTEQTGRRSKGKWVNWACWWQRWVRPRHERLSVLSPNGSLCVAPRFDLSPRMALDLRTGYDFSKEAGRLRAPECLRKVKPFLLAAFFTLHIIVAIADSGKRHQAMEGNGKWRTSTLDFSCVRCTKSRLTVKSSFCMNNPHKRKSGIFRCSMRSWRCLCCESHGRSMHFWIVVHWREGTSPGPQINGMTDQFIEDRQNAGSHVFWRAQTLQNACRRSKTSDNLR